MISSIDFSGINPIFLYALILFPVYVVLMIIGIGMIIVDKFIRKTSTSTRRVSKLFLIIPIIHITWAYCIYLSGG